MGHSAHGALWWAIAGLLALVLLALVGVACGCLCRSRVAALALVALLSGVPLMLATFGQFPPALWFRSLFPGGALDAVFDRREGVRGDAWLRWGVPATYLLAAFVIVAAGCRSSDPGVARAIKDAEPAPARGRAARLAGVAPIALLITAAAALGAVAPERMATAIPWWLQGPWIEDLALERASEPVARAYLSAVRSGDVRRERRLVLGRRALDPVQRALIGRARRVTDVTYVYAEDVPPGTVLAELGGDVTVTICNRRTRQGWRVVRVSTIGVCP